MHDIDCSQQIPEMERYKRAWISAVENEPANGEARGPDERKCDRIADRGTQCRSSQIASDKQRNNSGDDEMQAHERQERCEYSGRHPRSNRMRRGG
ncbi:hypothetical protein MesoLj131a_68590 (plasmid) [Mesorhizobium sp. 131-2-1]|nr:hypothetical protein MesoLj131a_68590 [Mesorhizobium sp. 131-2-1]